MNFNLPSLLATLVLVAAVLIVCIVLWRVLRRKPALQEPLRELGREFDDEAHALGRTIDDRAHEIAGRIRSRTQRGGGSGDDGGG